MTSPANDVISATPLRVCEVGVTDLRCHEKLTWQCDPGLNMIIGANGSGKTSLLEAVYLMANGRSFRQARDPFLVRRGQARFFIQGSWHRFGPINLSAAGQRVKISLRFQGRDVQRRKDVSESFPILVEAPQGSKLIDGAPNERRRWLDGLVMTCFQGLNIHYDRYLRAVMQRGRLLRKRQLSEELDVWEHQIVLYGLSIIEYRNRLIDELNEALTDEQNLTEHPLMMRMKNPACDEAAWLKRLQDKRQDDMRIGGLRFGPHCDGVQMYFQEREIRSAGSRGQQKLAAIAIKMAECALWRQYRRMLPVLLLDDCLEALDRERQTRTLQRLAEYPGQTLITAPQGVSISSGIDIRMQQLQAGLLRAMTAGHEDISEEVRMTPETGPGSQTTMMEEAA